MAPKNLSSAQGVEAAAILFELNTKPEQVDALAREAGLVPHDATAEQTQNFRLHWYGYVHAAVVAGLMVHAPNIVMATYLRSTRYLLKNLRLNDEICARFVDTYFAPFMELLLRERQQECPGVFLRRCMGIKTLDDAPPHGLAILAGAMALTLGAVHDNLSAYSIAAD